MTEKPSQSGTNLDYKQIFQSLSQAIAVIDPLTHQVIYENAIFFDWFAPDDDVDGAIADRLPDLKMDRLMSRIEEGRSFRFETEVKIKSRDVPARVSFRPVEIEGQPYILTEAYDITMVIS